MTKFLSDIIDYHARRIPPTNSTDINDYQQIGRITVEKCREKYNDDKNTKFETYAHRAIGNNILREYQKFNKTQRYGQPESYVEETSIWEFLPDDLTEQEKKCVQLLVDKNKLKIIAKEMNIRRIDVKRILENVIKKVKISNGEE